MMDGPAVDPVLVDPDSFWRDGPPQNGRRLTDYERGWLEALIDSEGCIYFGLRYERGALRSWYTAVKAGNKNRKFLEKAVRIVGGGALNPQKVRGNREGSWQVTWHASIIRRFLPELDLVVKRRQKELMLEVLRMTSGWRKGRGQPHSPEATARLLEIAKEFRVLNRRGRLSKLETMNIEGIDDRKQK
jgi:hypothetical protein